MPPASLPAWDTASLRAWFEAQPGREGLETDLLRALFPDEDVFASGVGLDLFHKHFLLYRRLWLFDDEVRAATGQRLWIRSIRATLVDPPALGCRWLDPETGKFCGGPGAEEGLCGRHRGPGLETPTMKAYYLDWSHFDAMTDQGVKDLVGDFFRRLAAGDEGPALEAFGLPENATGPEIRARWRELVKRHHPDQGGDSAEFRKVRAAWAVLRFRVGP